MSKMLSPRNVMYGPSDNGMYPVVTTVSANATVTAVWKEGSWVLISAGGKRGYVPASTIQVTESVPTITFGNAVRYVHTAGTTYLAPNTSYAAGSVNYGETVWYSGRPLEGNYAYIEYYTNPSGTQRKRAYFPAGSLGTAPPAGGMANYRTFKLNAVIPANLPFAGATVSQGFNDTYTNYKGHLGYDMTGFSAIKPIFPGTVAAVQTSNTPASGRAVCVMHTVNGATFYSTYCHLASVSATVGSSVTTSTTIGTMGGSGNGSNSEYSIHLHLCVYTGSAQTNPYGYCSANRNQTFAQAAPGYANSYYYGPDQSKFPRCGGVCFYDPYGVITSNAEVIKLYHP